MRKAAVMAGLVPNTQAGHARLVFVSEGEASLHFAIENGMLHDAMSVRFFPFSLPAHLIVARIQLVL